MNVIHLTSYSLDSLAIFVYVSYFIPIIFFVPRFVTLTFSAYQQFHRSRTESSDVSFSPSAKLRTPCKLLHPHFLTWLSCATGVASPSPSSAPSSRAAANSEMVRDFFLDQRLISRWNLLSSWMCFLKTLSEQGDPNTLIQFKTCMVFLLLWSIIPCTQLRDSRRRQKQWQTTWLEKRRLTCSWH